MTQKKNIVLSTTEPITDGGRKYNFLYFIGAIAGFILGICLGNFGGGIFFAVIGMLAAWGIKNLICNFTANDLRGMTFNCSGKVPYDYLIQKLQPYLLPLNMTIECGTVGNPIISYKGLIYDVTYNEDNTFTIWWRQSLVRAFITSNEYISVYRKASVAYGIIAYHIQQICSEEAENKFTAKSVESDTTNNMANISFVKNPVNNTPIYPQSINAAGSGKEKKKTVFRVIATFFAIVVIGLAALYFIGVLEENKYINYVKEGSPEIYPNITYEEAFHDFFYNPKWKYFESEKGADVVEFTGGCYYADTKVTVTMQFVLDIDDGTFTLEYFGMNDVPQTEFMMLVIIEKVFESYGTADTDHVIEEDIGKPVAKAESFLTRTDNYLTEETEDNYDDLLEPQVTEEIYDDTTNRELHGSENIENKKIDYSLWEDAYQRSTGPSSSIFIDAIDENGIVFTASIGASGYTAYVDMREFYAEWIEENMALYKEGSEYELYFVLNEDGSIYVSENAPYYGDIGLAGYYTKESNAVYPDCEFVFPQSADRYISVEECEGLYELECKIARNEIYARHGRKFADESLQGYFDVCSWYNGIIEPEDFSTELLNNYEQENLRIIGEYETKMGYQ